MPGSLLIQESLILKIQKVRKLGIFEIFNIMLHFYKMKYIFQFWSNMWESNIRNCGNQRMVLILSPKLSQASTRIYLYIKIKFFISDCLLILCLINIYLKILWILWEVILRTTGIFHLQYHSYSTVCTVPKIIWISA